MVDTPLGTSSGIDQRNMTTQDTSATPVHHHPEASAPKDLDEALGKGSGKQEVQESKKDVKDDPEVEKPKKDVMCEKEMEESREDVTDVVSKAALKGKEQQGAQEDEDQEQGEEHTMTHDESLQQGTATLAPQQHPDTMEVDEQVLEPPSKKTKKCDTAPLVVVKDDTAKVETIEDDIPHANTPEDDVPLVTRVQQWAQKPTA